MSGRELDDILDQALDDFESLELSDQAHAIIGNANNTPENGLSLDIEEKERRENQAKMGSLMSHMNDPSYGKTLQSTLQTLSNTTGGTANVDELFDQLSKQFDLGDQPGLMPDGPDDVAGTQTADREVAATLKMIADSQKGMQGFEAGKMEEVGESMMEDMMAQFEELGEKEDYNEVIDGVMRQLLSKDLMYEPTRQICEKFPEWLAIHKKSLTTSEYENYGRQYQSFQKLLAVFDTEPDNFPRLMELMFDMQQYGQPPAEIIKDLAPGLKFDENGLPIMPNMGTGMMPDMPGGEGLPNLAELSGNMASGQCCIS